MSKDDDLKIVQLKVSINCCEGCRRKVLKALSIKGVLKTEIHSTLPKVTVHGSVDASTLIKKLSKCGKAAELWPTETQKPQIEETKSGSRGKAIEVKAVDEKKIAKDCEDHSKNSDFACTESTKPDERNQGSRKGDKGAKNAEISTQTLADSVPEAPTPMFPAMISTIPPVSYMVSPNMVQSPAANVMYSQAPVYNCYPVDPHGAPMAYYTVSTHYAPPPGYIHSDYPYSVPFYHHHPPPPPSPPPPPPPVQAQAMGFSDYFNDDNTVGCRVM